ncbi:MAG: SLC13 family permease, partial [Acidobacteriota bacterium]
MSRNGGDRGVRRRWIGRVLGPLLLLATLLLPAPDGLDPAGWRTVGCGLLMATWWVTEAIPIPATALLPLALFPLLGVAGLESTAPPYANPLIFLFLGGFLLAAGMERWGLPRRIALGVVGAVGPGSGAVVAGFMASAEFLSMWVSNTATAVMMLPIGISVLELVRDREPAGDPHGHFGTALMLGIAYGCSIGGLGTLIGTPPNAFLAGFLSETYGVEITFVRWMAFGLPLVVVGLPLAWWVLTRLVFPHG